jgi:hypothetical protein
MGIGGAFSSGQSGQDVKLTTHLQLVLRSRIHGTIHSLPQFMWGQKFACCSCKAVVDTSTVFDYALQLIIDDDAERHVPSIEDLH